MRNLTLAIFTLGIAWIAVNVFFLPFFPWTEGLFRPWLIINGLAPYRDALWNRGAVDIYLLAAVYKFFGVSPLVYQSVMFVLYGGTAGLIFLGLRRHRKLAITAFVIYVLFLPVFFSNAEIEEVLVGLFALGSFFSLLWFWERKQSVSLVISGALAGLAVMTKQTSGIIVIVTIVYILFIIGWNLKKARTLVWYLGGAACTVGGAFLFLASQGILGDFFASLLFVASVYNGWAKAWGIREGAMLAFGLLSLVVPFLFISRKQALMPKEISWLLPALVISLFALLLPSYWSYRLVAAFPLWCIIAAVVVLEGYRLRFVLAGVGITLFLVFTFPFARDYIQFIRDNGVSFGQYIRDYGEDELAVAAWLRKHTTKETRVFNLANNIILLESERLPHNRYVGGMPIDFLPFDKTAAEMSQNPPLVAIVDRRVLTDWPELKTWGFIDFLQKRYTLQQEFGSIAIYSL